MTAPATASASASRDPGAGLTRRALHLLVLIAAPAGCLEAIEPEVGPPVRDLCKDEDSDPARDVSFARDIVPAIFADPDIACNACHTPGGATPLGVEIAGLDLSSFGDLRAGGVVSGGDIVLPGQPCDSVLVQKVSSGPPYGSRMPLDGPPFLTDDERQLLADWIAEGARDN